MSNERRRYWLSATGVLLLLASVAWWFSGTQRLSRLVSGDPIKDCEAAVARGDLRFYAVNGFASGMVLGTDQYGVDRDLIEAYGVRTLDQTSDYSSNGQLNQRANEYARAYNTALVRHLRSSSPGSATEPEQSIPHPE
jgi:hypothetical protein